MEITVAIGTQRDGGPKLGFFVPLLEPLVAVERPGDEVMLRQAV